MIPRVEGVATRAPRLLNIYEVPNVLSSTENANRSFGIGFIDLQLDPPYSEAIQPVQVDDLFISNEAPDALCLKSGLEHVRVSCMTERCDGDEVMDYS